MAGNSQRRGATRKGQSRKGPQVGTGGHRRRGLEGKKDTPRAEDRPHHPAARRKRAQERQTQRQAQVQLRRKAAENIVYGRNAVLEALQTRLPLQEIAVLQTIEADPRVNESLAIAVNERIPLQEVDRATLDRLCGGGSHQGIAALAEPYEYPELDDVLATLATQGVADPVLLLCDGITDPRNLGALIRSAGAFGVSAVVVPERRSVGVTPVVWKTSVGAVARVPVVQVVNITRTLKELQEQGYFAVGLDGDGEADIATLPGDIAHGPLAVVVGAEGAGLSRLVAETCDVRAHIPIATAVESLNASVAGSIAFYAITQARAQA